MNGANRVTILRLILLPIIIALLLISGYGPLENGAIGTTSIKFDHYELRIAGIVAALIFGIAAFTDFLDGGIARRFNQTTTFGKFADAVADKILNNSVIIIFAVMQILPIGLVLICFIRDFVVDALRQVLSSKKVIMGAGPLGKGRTAIQMVGLFILFFVSFHNFGGSGNATAGNDEYGYINQIVLIPMYLATLFAIISMFDYIAKNRKIIFASLKSDDAANQVEQKEDASIVKGTESKATKKSKQT